MKRNDVNNDAKRISQDMANCSFIIDRFFFFSLRDTLRDNANRRIHVGSTCRRSGTGSFDPSREVNRDDFPFSSRREKTLPTKSKFSISKIEQRLVPCWSKDGRNDELNLCLAVKKNAFKNPPRISRSKVRSKHIFCAPSCLAPTTLFTFSLSFFVLAPFSRKHVFEGNLFNRLYKGRCKPPPRGVVPESMGMGRVSGTGMGPLFFLGNLFECKKSGR